MRRGALMDSVNFWGIFGALAAGLGVVPGAVAVAVVSPKWSRLLSNVWFDIAIAFWAVGVLALLRMAWLRTAHLHAEGHRCPDPEAHTHTQPRLGVVRNEINIESTLPLKVPPPVAPRSPVTVDAKIPTAEPRVMCALSPKELMRLHALGATAAQGESLIAPYKTQWREVSAVVEEVIPQNEVVFSVNGKDSEQAAVIFFFDPGIWAPQLQGLMPNDPVRVVGSVGAVTNYHVLFKSCEFVEASQGGGMPATSPGVRPS
jgi:hypothetical protein